MVQLPSRLPFATLDESAAPAQAEIASADVKTEGGKKPLSMPTMWGGPNTPTSVKPPCGEYPAIGLRMPQGRIGKVSAKDSLL